MTANGANDCCKQQGETCTASYSTDPNVDTMINGQMYRVCCLENTNYDGASNFDAMPACTSAESTTPASAAAKDVTETAVIGLALAGAALHVVI